MADLEDDRGWEPLGVTLGRLTAALYRVGKGPTGREQKDQAGCDRARPSVRISAIPRWEGGRNGGG